MVKNLPANLGDASLIPGLGRSSEVGNGNPLQYFCLEDPMDRGSWRAAVHGVAKSRTQLSDSARMSVITAITIVLILPLQRKQLSESKWLGQGHTASGWQSQNWTVCLPVQHNFTAYNTAYPDHSISRLVKEGREPGFQSYACPVWIPSLLHTLWATAFAFLIWKIRTIKFNVG